MGKNFCGSLVAIVTPMDSQGAIDYRAFAALVEWHVAGGTDGIVVAGTTGESPTLSVAEHEALIAEAVRLVEGRMPVLAGVGANCTREAIALTRRACDDGADAGLSVVPYYNKPAQEGLYRHFSAIADSCGLPLILYDVPGRCVTRLACETVARLGAHDNIVGIKDAAGEVARAARLRAAVDDDAFVLLSGDDATCCEYVLNGGDGVVSVTANVAPAGMRRMVAAARAGDGDAARRLDASLRDFHYAQAVESNPIPVKAALAMMGKMTGGIRLPLTPLAAAWHARVAAAVDSARRSEDEVE